MSKTKKVLLATAFKQESEAALEYAARYAERMKTEIVIVHVIEQLSLIAENFMTKDLQENMMKFAEQKIISFANKIIKKRSVKIIPVVKKGKVYSVIPQVAKEHKVDFIFMGRTEKHDLVRNITGTNTNHIIEESQVPVITVRGIGEKTGFDHILLPLDLTKSTKEKVSEVVRIASLLKSRVSVVAVLEKDWVSRELKFSSRLKEINDIIEGFGINCQYKLIEKSNNKVSDILISNARELDAELILMMTREETGLRDFFIGSTAMAVIRKSEIPVMSIIPGAETIELLPSSVIENIIDPIGIV
jgi:nucleotide-binding universal stress UspA family protein